MLQIGYHISHEQFSPKDLLEYVQLAEKKGFQFALSSDHFYPWSEAQGHSGHAWTWLGAALAKTNFPIGVVNCPCYRYHPAIIAQAIATLSTMFPDRFWVAFGSGQLLNEGVIGSKWPTKQKRNEILKDAIGVIRRLLSGEEVNFSGAFELHEAKLYTLPPSPPEIIGAAISPETTGFICECTDGLITVNQPLEKLEKVRQAWHGAGGEKKSMTLKLQVSYDPNHEVATKGAFEQWKTNIFGSEMLTQLRTPKHFEQAAVHVTEADMKDYVLIGNDPDFFVEKILTCYKLGFSRIDIHNVNKNQEAFIHFFAEKVLPKLKVQ